MVKPLSESLSALADRIDTMHGEDSGWWKGYVAGIKRSAALAEIHEAFQDGEESCGG